MWGNEDLSTTGFGGLAGNSYGDNRGTGGYGGGGFNSSGYGGGGGFSASAKDNTDRSNERGGKGQGRLQCVKPVTIRQLLNGLDDKQSGSSAMMEVIGVVKGVEITSTKMVFTVEDWTDTVTAMYWLDADNQGVKKPKFTVKEDTYCRMFGTRRIHENAACMFVYNIAPIEDLSEITYHFLRVIHSPLTNVGVKPTVKGVDGFPASSSVAAPDDRTSYLTQSNSVWSRVYAILQNCEAEIGTTAKDIFQQLGGKVSIAEIDKGLEFLVGEGHVYNTIDETYYRATEKA